MKHTKEEIIGALKIIKEECEAHSNSCVDCPLYGHGCGVLDDIPSGWSLADPEPKTWRAFR